MAAAHSLGPPATAASASLDEETFAVENKAPRVQEMEVTVRFFTLGVAFAVSFFATLLVSAIVTFAWTSYSSDTDFVFRFYGVFNPCILFDHYPANVVGAT